MMILFGNKYISGQDTLQNNKIKILPVPAIGYSPETRTYLGVVSLFTLDFYEGKTRTSNAKLEFNYTWNKQVILESGWNYFFREEKWFSKGLLHYSKFPDLYYGIGSETPDSNKLSYNSKRINVDLNLLKNIGNNWFAGIGFKYIDYSQMNYSNSKIKFAELSANSTFGKGVSLLHDSRNNILTPSKGVYFYLNSNHNNSTQNYIDFITDIRYYKSWNDKLTLAARFLSELNSNSPPFYDLAYLGGDKNVRGYYFGRYRDNNLNTIQVEVRIPIYRRIGMATFGGYSNIYSQSNKFKINNSKYNCGLGIRFMVDKTDKTNLRIDYAMGKSGNSGFYVSFGESF